MPYISVNSKGIVTAVSDRQFTGSGGETIKIETLAEPRQLLGKRLVKKGDGLRVAMICNWDQQCGISTYTKYLVDALRPRIKELRIFSEEGCAASDGVVPCWKRGHSMVECMRKVVEWEPDFVLIQHEFGLFPKAPFLLQMLQVLDAIPHAVVLHSTYEHLDKTVCTGAMKNIIVHSHAARDVLRRLGSGSTIKVIPHGCVEMPDRKELWNIYQTQHAMVQFGFGFFYKGVDRAIDAVNILKTKYPEKYASGKDDIFYCYYCSENGNTRNIHSEYQNYLAKKIDSLGLNDNVVIIKKYHTDQEINNILRTAKLAIFPYLINPDNVVYGASGALRISFANGIPCIASESHLFDEIDGLPRPTDAEGLAGEIHRVFSDWKYKDSLIANQDEYVRNNTWSMTADRYVNAMQDIRKEGTLLVD